MENSFEEAKKLFEEHREEMDQTLGELDDLHRSGPSMPKLTQTRPRMPYTDFVELALRTEGFELSTDERGLLRAVPETGLPELVTFDEQRWREENNSGVFMGRAPKLYTPGKPAFERLVQRWLDRAGHRVMDIRPETVDQARDVAEMWLQKIPGSEITGIKILDRTDHFQGEAKCRAKASNALDSYEKLLSVKCKPTGHKKMSLNDLNGAKIIGRSISPESVAPNIKARTQKAINTDDDVTAFCEFYEARLAEDLEKADRDAALRRKVKADLSPELVAEIASLEGAVYDSCTVEVSFAIGGKGGYASQLKVCAATEQVLEEPAEWARCHATDLRVPVECLGKCGISNELVLGQLLATSEESGRQALAKYVTRCPVSGKLALVDELKQSDVSGKLAVASLLVRSPISGRSGLPDEVVACEFTNSQVLKDEIGLSDVSGRCFRVDQTSVSAVSGKRGHASEFVQCCATRDDVLAEECEVSDMSGRRLRRDLAQRSDKPPSRIGTPDEFAVCSASGKRLLKDEVGVCCVSGKTVDLDLMAVSDGSGRLAELKSMVKCSVTQRVILPDEAVESAVSGRTISRELAHRSPVSGLLALPDEYERCEFSDELVLPDELIESDVSGRRFRRDELAVSSESGRRGHNSESVNCEFSERVMLIDEVAASDYSGKKTFAVELIKSERSGRMGHRTEMVKCSETKKILVKDEVGKSLVSGDFVDRELLVKSAGCDGHALQRELIRCPISQKYYLPTEMQPCSVTEILVYSRLLRKSDLSNAMALPQAMATCPITSKVALPLEFGRCQLTGDAVVPSELAKCEFTGKLIRSDKVVRSAVSGRAMHPTVAVNSIIDNQPMCPDESTYCYWNDGNVLPIQAKICALTGLPFATDLIASDGEFNIFRRLLDRNIQSEDLLSLIPWLRTQAGTKLKGLKRGQFVYSKQKKTRFIIGAIDRMFSLRVRYVAMAITQEPELKIIGRIRCNSFDGRGWLPYYR